jgi:hypothetical protein
VITFLVAIFMWLLVFILALRAHARPDNTMLSAAIFIAGSLTSNIDEVYLWINSLLPWANAVDLLANLLLVTGVYYLSVAISRGATKVGALRERETVWMRRSAQVTGVVMAVSFSLIDDPNPSTAFMRDYGDQLAAGIYSAVQYVYIFAVMAGTLLTCLQNVPRMRRARFRVGFSIIGAGCISALLLCVTVIAMDVGNIVGAESFLALVSPWYDLLYLVTVLFLCTGLAIPPVGRLTSGLILQKQLRAIEPEIRRIWLMTVAESPSVSLVGTTLQQVKERHGPAGPSSVDTLHRLVIEIHDWLNVENHNGFELCPKQRTILRRAESLCLKQRGAVR